MSRDNCIRVWRFRDAPAEYRALSRNGGDEDWVALIPAGYPDDAPAWTCEGSQFGCCTVEHHRLEDGSVVRIGCHA